MLVLTCQIRAARALVGWEQSNLATEAGIGISTVRRLEGINGRISAHVVTVEKIRAAFERAGVEFIGPPKPGVCLLWRAAVAPSAGHHRTSALDQRD